MYYKRFGEIFHALRKQKEMSLRDFEDAGISKSTISRFEKGQTMMRFDHLDVALQEMHVPLSEYEYFLNDFENDYFEELFLMIERAYYRHDRKQLEKLYKDANIYGFEMIALAVKGMLSSTNPTSVIEDGSQRKLSKLTVDEQKEIILFLHNVKSWGIYELFIFSFVVEYLEEGMIVGVMREFWVKSTNYEDIFKYGRLMALASHRAILSLILCDRAQLAERLLERAGDKIGQSDLFARNTHRFIEGYYIYRFKSTLKGEAQMRKCLDVFNFLGSVTISAHYQLIYKRLIKEKNGE
jgi:Rgg/GadR/MutR family transcriptional activator